MSKLPAKTIVIGNKRYTLTLFRVRSTDGHGRPLSCDRIDDGQTVVLNGGEEFMTAYIPEVMLERNWPSSQADVRDLPSE